MRRAAEAGRERRCGGAGGLHRRAGAREGPPGSVLRQPLAGRGLRRGGCEPRRSEARAGTGASPASLGRGSERFLRVRGPLLAGAARPRQGAARP